MQSLHVGHRLRQGSMIDFFKIGDWLKIAGAVLSIPVNLIGASAIGLAAIDFGLVISECKRR